MECGTIDFIAGMLGLFLFSVSVLILTFVAIVIRDSINR